MIFKNIHMLNIIRLQFFMSCILHIIINDKKKKINILFENNQIGYYIGPFQKLC